MQPNLQQDVKFNYAAKAEVMQNTCAVRPRFGTAIHRRARRADPDLAESAFPFFLAREADAMAQIAELLPKGTVLMTGSVRAPNGRPAPASAAPITRYI